MEEKDCQKKSLEEIFRSPTFAPIFKPNPKYCLDGLANLTPYISYKDILKNKISIRGCPIGCGNNYDSGQRDIIVEYKSLDELVDDGWCLD